MEGSAGAGFLHALARWRGGGAERGEVQPAPALDTSGYPGGEIEGWIGRTQTTNEGAEEKNDDREDVLRLPTRGREAHRRGHGGVAVPRDGSLSGSRRAGLKRDRATEHGELMGYPLLISQEVRDFRQSYQKRRKGSASCLIRKEEEKA
jgi:hypothetical protein